MNIQETISLLRTLEEQGVVKNEQTSEYMGFDMSIFLPEAHLTDHACGTAACICGWVNALAAPKEQWTENDLAEHWGISQDDAHMIVFATGSRVSSLESIPPGKAADVLEHYLATGVVDWSGA